MTHSPMTCWTCEQCGAQFPESDAPPQACPICEDERQYVSWKGQTWLTSGEMAQRCKLVWRDDLGVPGIGVEPSFAIGQRALLLREPDGGVMWDCVPLATPEAVDYVKSLGGLKAIAISHPHYYGAVADWSAAFGGVPVYLHGDDRAWITPAASLDRAVVWRKLPAFQRYPDPAHRRPFRRRHRAALARRRGRARRAVHRRCRDGRDGPPFGQLHVQLSELHPAQRASGSPHRRCRRAAGIRPHLRRLVGAATSLLTRRPLQRLGPALHRGDFVSGETRRRGPGLLACRLRTGRRSRAAVHQRTIGIARNSWYWACRRAPKQAQKTRKTAVGEKTS